MAKGLLTGVRVLDVSQRVSGPYCAKVLAQLGAEVIKVEPPGGDEARKMGPFPDGEQHSEKSALFLALNMNKYGITLDLNVSEDRSQFQKLVSTSDIVVENILDYPDTEAVKIGLDYPTLKGLNPGVILTSVTPFGSWGPYAGHRATDLILYHMSGNAHGLLGAVENTDTQPPIRAGGHQAELVAGMAAATATMMALFKKRMTGKGSHVEVSSYEAMVNQLISGLANTAYGKPAPPRDLSRVKEAAIGGMVGAVGGVLPCTDGYVAISPREDAQWERWLEVMGNPDWATDERFVTRDAREQNHPALWELVGEWSRLHSKQDIARWGQEKRIPCFPVNTAEDLLGDEHLAQRQFFVELEHPVAGAFKYPGAPYKLSNADLPLAERPAPLLGQHNDMFLGGLE